MSHADPLVQWVIYDHPADFPDHWVVWVIYDHPADFPDHWVVRRWYVTDVARPDPFACLCGSLEQARRQVPAGLFRWPRPDPDPAIAEVYF